ncbi:MAG: lipopolysaccharide assembly protein LapA domain-containing protein [Candidatus Accumulibacter sp.]|nr:lipopolysaccharide assembly protein LapA domain-containing protein [Accumulibacter sp.]
MRVLLWCCRVFIFLFLLAFALKNAEPVRVSFFFDASWQAPLIIVALVFFAGGIALGLLGLLGTVFRLRREIRRLKREARAVAVETAKTLDRGDTAIS